MLRSQFMSKLLVKPNAPDNTGEIINITPEKAGWTYTSFMVHTLNLKQMFSIAADRCETCIVIVTGKVTVQTKNAIFENVGERTSVFEDKAPYCVYIPYETDFNVVAVTEGAEVALCRAPGGGNYKERLITPDDIPIETRGEGTNVRHVRNILPETKDAHSLLIAEVITPGGNWSSYPPHKHDSDLIPEESALEETYYYKINPKQGFALQRVYTDDRSLDETISVTENDVVMVPEGYHPVGAPHGYDVYYLNVMAGPKRKWIFKNDPEHEWIVQKSK